MMSPLAARPRVSVIVPAHNEEAVVACCIRTLLDDATEGEFDVVVIANACNDQTAARAREAGARVLETPIAGKAHALRLGDAAARAFPRLYLDADVVIDAASVRALVAKLAEPGIMACAPVPRLDLEGVGPVARRVHLVHNQLIEPYRALAGVGLYAVNAEGHTRIFPLPDVLADDEWVHRSFALHERSVVNEAYTLIQPAPTVRSHLRRRARVRAGNDQLLAFGRPQFGPSPRIKTLVALRLSGSISTLDTLCYAIVTACDRGLAVWRRYAGRSVSWGTKRSPEPLSSR